MRLSYITYEAE